MSETVAESRSVSFGYGKTPVLERASLQVRRGETLFIVGPNGAGKSTLLKLLAGLLIPSAGTISVFGEAPSQARRRDLARRLAYLPQSYRVSFPFTALEIVLMGRYAHDGGSLALESEADLSRAQAAMESSEVWELRERRYFELSGGEQRRVLLAQALCQEAELLLLDEPTASLDPAHGIHLFEALREASRANEAMTTIVVSHDLNLAARFASRVAVIHDGAIACIGPTLETLQAAETRAAFGVELLAGVHSDGQTPFIVAR